MKGILSYDSKFMGILENLANVMILNLLFILFCLPVFTIGAAYTALYSGCRAIAKKEPCFRAFFRGFRTSFKRATLAWLILLPLTVVFAFNTVAILFYKADGFILPLVLSLVTLVILLAVDTMVFVFYSRFECTLLQLLKNSLLLVLARPLRSIINGLMAWLPVLLFFLLPLTFMQMVVVWAFLYFATMAMVAVWLMNKPFALLAQQFLEGNAVEARVSPDAVPAETEEEPGEEL